ncbi:MAG: hypothetical protein EAX96_06380 [Candidatus Lokiarchaeota archaeon]|nr:hypothetical protein [Candidatus Lokiarchaeota archaeon]
MDTNENKLSFIIDILKAVPNCLLKEEKQEFEMILKRNPNSINEEYVSKLYEKIIINIKSGLNIEPKRKIKFKPERDDFIEKGISEFQVGDQVTFIAVIFKNKAPHYQWVCKVCSEKISKNNPHPKLVLFKPKTSCPRCGRSFLMCPDCKTKALVRGKCVNDECGKIWYDYHIFLRFYLQDNKGGKILAKASGKKPAKLLDIPTLDLIKALQENKLDLDQIIGKKFRWFGNVGKERSGTIYFRPLWWEKPIQN